MIRYDMEQGSVEWFFARRGIPTASCFSKIMTPKTHKMAAGATSYIYEMIADLAGGGAPVGVDNYTSREMQDGLDMEPEARAMYELETDRTVERVGFCTTDDGKIGASPDGIIVNDRALELKVPKTKTHVEWLAGGCVPLKHEAQCHGHMIALGLDKCDFYSYSNTKLPDLLVTVERDEYTEKLEKAIEVFQEMYEEIKSKPCYAPLFEASDTTDDEPQPF